MRQRIVMNDTWFETVEALSAIQEAKHELEYLIRTKNLNEDAIVEICDIELSDARASVTALLLRSQGLERWYEDVKERSLGEARIVPKIILQTPKSIKANKKRTKKK